MGQSRLNLSTLDPLSEAQYSFINAYVHHIHVVMFATNRMRRHKRQGTFFLLFNAALNYNNLGAGRAEPAPRPQQAGTNDDDQ